MTTDRPATMTIDAELTVPMATVRVARIEVSQPSEGVLYQDEGYLLDLSVTRRTPNARICFHDHWAAHRFEPPGRVFLLPPRELLKARSDCGTQVSIICVLKDDLFQRWLGSEFEWTDRRVQASLDVQAGTVQRHLLRLGEEARHPGFASAALCEAIAIEIAVELTRYYLAVGGDATPGGLPGWRLRRIEERLRETGKPPTLSELAELCGLSIRQLTRGFRASRGSSIGDHIAQTRIEMAKRLLDRDESVKAIAYAMGFGSPSSFCYAFRTATGATPRQYRLESAALRRGRLN